jgi:arylsulfatase A-like enzyme
MGRIDRLAQEAFGTNDFIFVYSADHGAQWPFGKWNLYDAGIRVPLIVRWPGRIKAGVRTGAMVSWVDLIPTLIDLAGGSVPAGLDGRSFAGVLLGKTNHHREVIYTTHSGDGTMNIYPIRSVRTERYKYIRNLRPDCYHSNHSDIQRKDGAGAYWDSWDAVAATNAVAAAVVAKYYQRPAEEFYDLEKDPEEQNNLAGNPEYQTQIKQLSSRLDGWMAEQGDTQRIFEEPYLVTGPRPVDAIKQKKSGSGK